MIFIWDHDANIIDYISNTKPRSQYLIENQKMKSNLIMYKHDIGESSCSKRLRDLIRLSYRKQPASLVISLDYSKIVSLSN